MASEVEEIEAIIARVERGTLSRKSAAAAIAALRAQDREGAREMRERAFIQGHRADTLRYMLDRAERMSRCFYRAGMAADGARYREESDALTWVLGALPLSPVRMEDGDA